MCKLKGKRGRLHKIQRVGCGGDNKWHDTRQMNFEWLKNSAISVVYFCDFMWEYQGGSMMKHLWWG
jgi:hypothetical protein